MRSRHYLVAIIGLLLGGSVICCQSNSFSESWNVPRARPPLGVKGKPFVASFEESHFHPAAGGGLTEKKFVGRIFRDSHGRTRTERHEVDGNDEVVVIYDEEQNSAAIVLPAVHQAFSFEKALVPGDPRRKWSFVQAIPVYTNSTKSIHGVLCQKVEMYSKDPSSQSAPDRGEAWIAIENGIVLADSMEGSHWWQVTSLSFEEPSATLFKVPSTYEIVRDDQ